jgi:signal transduction histidine kinase/ActR/RegA family two-component response regulator
MEPSAAGASILVVDDEPNVLATVQAILRQEGYQVHAARGGDEAISAIQSAHYDLVLTDLKMPGIDGLGVLAAVRKYSPETVTVMMTGYASLDSALEAVQLGAYEYLLKPTEVPQLKMAVKRSLERKHLSEIDTLYNVSLTIASRTDPDPVTISGQISDAVCRVLGISEACVIALQRQHSANCPVHFKEILAHPEVLARLARGEPVSLDTEMAPLGAWAARNSLASAALVPGIANDRLVCVLCASNGTQSYEFHASALRFLRALSCQAALALDNAALIAELKANNDALLTANRKLKELDTLKSQFLSVATHELRTPLTVILGYNSMLSESLHDRLSEEERETLSESIAACKRLIRLVNSMLDMAQIEAGKMRMDFVPADLRSLVQSVAALFQQEARSRDIMLEALLPSRLPKITLDPERVQQVLINLVANALKFTPPAGKVRIQVHPVDREQIAISVSDTGTGIARADQDKIFDEFAQVKKHAAQRQKTGSGLGLAIVRRIVEGHHGTISLESEPGRGSTFTVTLPLRQTSDGRKAVSA